MPDRESPGVLLSGPNDGGLFKLIALRWFSYPVDLIEPSVFNQSTF
jgi:hypothetical protein